MDKRKHDIAYFLSFCIEQYKTAKGISGAEAMRRLDNCGALDYLTEHYDVLHTQGHRWLLAEMDEYIRLRNETVSR